jgi:hypothetical protein
MRTTSLPVVLLIGALVCGCATAQSPAAATHTPTPRATPSPVFAVYPSDPVLPHGPAGAFDGRYIDPGAIILSGGTWHMFYDGINSYPAPVQVGYATSSDGYSWTRRSDKPVLRSQQVSYAGVTIFLSSGLVTDNGTWVLYFSTYEDGDLDAAPGYIGRATAPGPTGPWTPDPAPLLSPGPAGAWDGRGVDHPSVLRTATGYVMYYNAEASLQDPTPRIGMATSPDGIHWTKRKDPATTDPQFADSAPVLTPGPPGAWDAAGVRSPSVQKTPGGWVMTYLSRGLPAGQQRVSALGYATSTDGVTWTKARDNPIVSTATQPGWTAIYETAFIYQEGSYYLYFDVDNGTETDIYLITHRGALAG